jgi:coenzyme F420-0:L-glutamate ligase/coenzyme F420-1:gamma-L-glutamate ligase
MAEPGLEVRPVTGIGEVRPGDDLAALILAAAPWIADGDVVVVTSKVVSKAEGRTVEVPADGPAREAAREAALAAETVRPVARRGNTHIVQTRHGFVLASAGIDASNVDRTRLVLLPLDPDASARRLREALRRRFGRRVAVVVTDTMGRPWRIGLTDVAVGAAGVAALRDHRGQLDPYGNELQLTQMAVVDELASAAELVKGKCDKVPVAVVRGYGPLSDVDGDGVRPLIRSAAEDLFSLGTAEARAAGRHEVATLADATAFGGAAVDPTTVDRAVAALNAGFVRVLDEGVRDKLRALLPVNTAEIVVPWAPTDDPWRVAEAGACLHRLRGALLAEGLCTAWIRVDPALLGDLVPLPGEALGVLAIGAPA